MNNNYYMIQLCHSSIYPREINSFVHTKPWTQMFMATLFIIAKNKKQCPSTDEWINQVWYIHTTEYLLYNKKEWNTDTHYMDKPWNIYAEWKKPYKKQSAYCMNLIYIILGKPNWWQKAGQWLLGYWGWGVGGVCVHVWWQGRGTEGCGREKQEGGLQRGMKTFGGNEYIHYLDYGDGFMVRTYVKSILYCMSITPQESCLEKSRKNSKYIVFTYSYMHRRKKISFWWRRKKISFWWRQ